MNFSDGTRDDVKTLLVNYYADDGATDTASVDVSNFSHVVLVITGDTVTGFDLEQGEHMNFTVEDSDDNSTFATVAGIGEITYGNDIDEELMTIHIDTLNVRRYLRVHINQNRAKYWAIVAFRMNNAQSLATSPNGSYL
jgi:hypothetical protein